MATCLQPCLIFRDCGFRLKPELHAGESSGRYERHRYPRQASISSVSKTYPNRSSASAERYARTGLYESRGWSTAGPASDVPRPSALAARFAAKEATLKALRPDMPSADWRSIEVLRHASGRCEVVLHGRGCGARRASRHPHAGAQHKSSSRSCRRRRGSAGRDA